jgi:hypothetical protein
MKTTETTFYVLPEGSTQEEPWSWDAIEEKCRNGQFTAETQIFLPDKNTWVRAADTELRSFFKESDRPKPEEAPEEAEPEDSELETEYREAARLAGEHSKDVDAQVDAGRLAAELGDREAARKYFQTALRLKPFHRRVAQEVLRRFSKSECKEFLYLQRDPPVWDEPADLVTFPLSAGPLYLAVPAAALFVLLLIPFGFLVAATAAYLWGLQVARRSADGDTEPPLWHAALANPVREIVLPLLAAAAVVGECVLVVYCVGRLAVLAAGSELSAFHYVGESPVLSVTLTVVALAYLPAVFVKTTHSVGMIVNLLNPLSIVRAIARMGQEYVISALAILLLAFIMGGVKFLVGGVPALGKLCLAVAAAVFVPVAGFILGRLTGRMRHIL